MASFYYYEHNPFRFHKILYSQGGLNNKGPNFAQESKTLKDSGRGSKIMSSCNWPIDLILLIENFHSRDQHLCKFIGTKETVYIRKMFNYQDRFGTPTWLPFHNMTDLTSSQKGLYVKFPNTARWSPDLLKYIVDEHRL